MTCYNINRIKSSPYLYFDGKFISTKDFYQLIIFMFYEKSSEKKIPGFYDLIYNQYGNSYIEVLKSFKNIITNENTNNLKIKSITSDFEKPLIIEIKKVFKGIRQVGCYFHFVKNNILKM